MMNYRTLSRGALAATICLATLVIAAPNEATAQGIQFRINTRGYSAGYGGGYRNGPGGYGASRYRSSGYGYSRYETGRSGYGRSGYRSSTRYGYPSSRRYGSRGGGSINLYYGGSPAYRTYGYRSY